MKIFGLLLAAILAGTAVGVGSSWATFRSAHDRLTAANLFGVTPDPKQSAGSLHDMVASPDPRIVIDNEMFDFGVMENGEHSEHVFVIANDGGKPLEIELIKISCGCTNSDLEQGKPITIQPGKTRQVTLDWYANASDGHFRQAATLSTNDPRRPQIYLIITGKVIKGVVADPPGFLVNGLGVGQSGERELNIFSYRDKDFKILDFEFQSGASPENYDVSFVALPPEALGKDPESKAKAGVKVKLQIKPGLPPGTVTHILWLKTNDSKKPELTLGISGTIDGPISLSGPRWNSSTKRLSIGAISREDGVKLTLLLKIVGVDPELLNPSVEKISPDVLLVNIGKSGVSKSNGRTTVIYPVNIEIPPGGPILTNLGTEQGPRGEIEIDSGHEETGKIKFEVEVVTVD